MGDGPLPKPHGTFTPASTIGRVLSKEGYAAFLVRKNYAYGGHRCHWDRAGGVVTVFYRCGDDIPDSQQAAERAEMLGLYEEFLKEKGYRVERPESGGSLIVYPKDAAK